MLKYMTYEDPDLIQRNYLHLLHHKVMGFPIFWYTSRSNYNHVLGHNSTVDPFSLFSFYVFHLITRCLHPSPTGNNGQTKMQKPTAPISRSAHGSGLRVRLQNLVHRATNVFHGVASCLVTVFDVRDIASRKTNDLKRKLVTLQNHV